MVKPHLRLFSATAADRSDDGTETRDQVTVPLGAVFPILADSLDKNRTWLRDFEDEAVIISADLYDVILAHQHFHRPSA